MNGTLWRCGGLFTMTVMQHLHFPNESPQYRTVRNALLAEEMELRRQVESVAAHRRALPPGGEISEDYVFGKPGPDGEPQKVKLSQLFEPGKDTLAVYSFMFGPERAPLSQLHAFSRRPRWSYRHQRGRVRRPLGGPALRDG